MKIWISQMWAWLVEASGPFRFLVLTILGLSPMVLAWAFLPAQTEMGVRFSGMLLQLLGISAVVKDIDSKFRLFGRSRAILSIREWWCRRPCKIRGKVVQASIGFSLGLSHKSRGLARLHADAPVDQRLTLLEHQVENIHIELIALEGELKKDLRKLDDDWKRRCDSLREEIKNFSDLLYESQSGGLYLALGGVVWIALGVVATSVPGEIAWILELLRWE